MSSSPHPLHLTKSASESALRSSYSISRAGSHGATLHGEWDGLSRRQSLHKADPLYGKPLPGSLSEYRGKQVSSVSMNGVRGVVRGVVRVWLAACL